MDSPKWFYQIAEIRMTEDAEYQDFMRKKNKVK